VGGSGGNGGGGSGGSGGGGGSGGSGVPDGGLNCGVQNFMLTKSGTPDLLIVQDRSGSMKDPPSMTSPPGTASKWTQITAAINQVVGSVTSVDWGLLFFEDPSGGSFGSCSVSSTPEVPCGANNAMAIGTAISGTTPGGGTPTPEAIAAGMQYLQGNTDGHQHYMLLATDGLPMCDTSDDSAAAEQAITTAAMNGIKTVVVGIGDDPTGVATLTAMANNGGMPNMTAGQPSYYQVNSTMDLVNVLTKIAGTIVSCDYALQTPPANPNLVTIQDNKGNTIPRDPTHMNGWDFGPGNMSIQFYGAACNNLQMGITTGIAAVYGCPPIQ
jgi:hypothetical protein